MIGVGQLQEAVQGMLFVVQADINAVFEGLLPIGRLAHAEAGQEDPE